MKLTKEFGIGCVVHRLDEEVGQCVHLVFLDDCRFGGLSVDGRTTTDRSTTVHRAAAATSIASGRIWRRSRVVMRTS